MTALVRKLFSFWAPMPQKSDFSAFFYDASEDEQRKVLMRVIKKANEDQRKVMEKYNKLQRTA